MLALLGRRLGAARVCRSASTRRSLRQHSSKGAHRFALLVDGDVKGPPFWSLAVDAVKEKGTLVHTSVFGPPEHSRKEGWSKALASLGVEFVPVHRTKGTKDPNDLAIGMEASRLISTGEADAIALAVTDEDFLYVARRLKSWGRRTLLVLTRNTQLGLAAAFANAGAEVAWVDEPATDSRLPKYKIILLNSGASTVQPLAQNDDASSESDDTQSIEFLHELGYLVSSNDPIVPAIAKFYHANALGPLTVWPWCCPRNEIAGLIARTPRKEWRRNPGDLAFIFPYVQHSGGSKSELNKYGSKACSSYVRGGGPFVLQSSPNLADEVLRRLGYLDDHLNSDFAEAADVFCGLSRNFRTLQSAGFSMSLFADVHSKRAVMHCVFILPSLFGTWQVAPRDATVRSYLVSQKELSSTALPPREVMLAMQSFARKHGLPLHKTYNALVMQISRHVTSSDACRRR